MFANSLNSFSILLHSKTNLIPNPHALLRLLQCISTDNIDGLFKSSTTSTTSASSSRSSNRKKRFSRGAKKTVSIEAPGDHPGKHSSSSRHSSSSKHSPLVNNNLHREDDTRGVRDTEYEIVEVEDANDKVKREEDKTEEEEEEEDEDGSDTRDSTPEVDYTYAERCQSASRTGADEDGETDTAATGAGGGAAGTLEEDVTFVETCIRAFQSLFNTFVRTRIIQVHLSLK